MTDRTAARPSHIVFARSYAPRWTYVRTAAEIAGCHPSSIAADCRAGRLDWHLVAGYRVVDVNEVLLKIDGHGVRRDPGVVDARGRIREDRLLAALGDDVVELPPPAGTYVVMYDGQPQTARMRSNGTWYGPDGARFARQDEVVVLDVPAASSVAPSPAPRAG